MAVGFGFVMIYRRTKSLMPCIITHSVFNGLSAFANEAVMTPQRQILSGILLAVIAGGYALYLALAVKTRLQKDEQSLTGSCGITGKDRFARLRCVRKSQ